MARFLTWLLAVVVAAAALLLVVAPYTALSTATPVAQLLAFRGAGGLVSVLLAAVLAATSAPRRGRGRRLAGTLLAVVLLLTGLVHVGTVASRGVVDDPPAAPATEPGAVTVLSLNTLDGASSPEDVADAAFGPAADVVALVETPVATARVVADLLEARGRPMQVFTDDPGREHRATSLLVSESFGEYRQVGGATGDDYLQVESQDGAGPVVVAVHPPRPGQVPRAEWVAALERVVDTCRRTPGVVVAGDFNATLDHGPMRRLGRCDDAAAAGGLGGAGAYGTWHAAIPGLLAAPIDHVLADGERWQVAAVGVADVGASDHRAVLVRLVPRDTGPAVSP